MVSKLSSPPFVPFVEPLKPTNGREPARLLLTTVYKPFGIPDEYNAPGNLVEHSLTERCFTRRQGMFNIRQQSVTFPFYLIAHNISAQTTILEYPTLEDFTAELEQGYDYVGIGCVGTTLKKARRMSEIVRERSPQTQLIVGGAGTTAIPDEMAPFSDHVCHGDGVRFMQSLLGDPQGRIRHPIVKTVQRGNTLLGLPAHDANFAVAVGLGCTRGCEFCSTSHQFNGRHYPLFESGRELFQYMKDVESYELKNGRQHKSIGFLIYDENFLMNRKLVEEFRILNREHTIQGTQFLCFVFSDAGVISEYSMDELIEIGVDSLWIGVESPQIDRYKKLQGVDVPELIQRLYGAGIKVFASMIAGFEDHTAQSIREDMDFALGLTATSFQYAPVDPIPGTRFYKRLKEEGRIPDRDLNYFSMSHYNMIHPSLSENDVLGLIDDFLDKDYEVNGPLVYRFLKGRWEGYKNLCDSNNAAVRERAYHYARDVIRGFPVMLLGEVFAPNKHVRGYFLAMRKEVQRAFRRRAVLIRLLQGELSMRDGGIYLFTSLPIASQLARAVLCEHVLRSDPRYRGVQDLIFNRSSALERARHGVVPSGQPESFRCEYALAT